MHSTVRRFISLSYGQLRMPYLAGVGPRLPPTREGARKRTNVRGVLSPFSCNRHNRG